MGNEVPSGKKGLSPNKKTDKLAFAETPGMYKQNMQGIKTSRDVVQRGSIVLQRRYRDDSIAEESNSIVSSDKKEPVKEEIIPVVKKEIVPKEEKLPIKEKSVPKETPVITNESSPEIPNNRRVRNRPVVSNKPSFNRRRQLPQIEEPSYNTRQRRYRPYNPNVSYRERPRRVNNAPSSESESDDDNGNIPTYNNNVNYNSRYNNTVKTFNRTKMYRTGDGFCQCDNNTCHQCGLTKTHFNNRKCCCSYSCYHNQHQCMNNHCNCPLKVTHYRTCPLNSAPTTPPKPFREQTFLLREPSRINYLPIREPLLQSAPFFNHHYSSPSTINIQTNNPPPISLPSPSMQAIPYANAFRLHHTNILYIISLTPSISSIHYATSSTDNTIKLWDDNIHLVSTIHNNNAHAKCLLHFQTDYLLSAEGINIIAYSLRPPHQVQHIFRGHVDEVNYLLLVGNKFVSVGNDKVLRLWSVDNERMIKCYEGHRGAVRKVVKVFNGVYLASYGDDRKILVWDLGQVFPLGNVDAGYGVADVFGTEFGFVSGSYDNKIRLYSLKGGNVEMFAVFEMECCYCRSFINADMKGSVFLFTTFVNEVVALDARRRVVIGVFKGPPYDQKINMIIKDYYWENGYGMNDNSERHFIGVCQDGCLYMWKYGIIGYNEEGLNEEVTLKLPTVMNTFNSLNSNYRRNQSLKDFNTFNTTNNNNKESEINSAIVSIPDINLNTTNYS